MQNTFRPKKASLVAVKKDRALSLDPAYLLRRQRLSRASEDQGRANVAIVTKAHRAGEVLSYDDMVELGFGHEYAHPRRDDLMIYQKSRWAYIQEFGYALPCTETLALIGGYGPIFEVGSGSGFWSKLLSDRGVDVVSVDNASVPYPITRSAHRQAVDMSADDAVREHAGRTVLMIWPCMDHSWSELVLKAMTAGQVIVYIGEGDGGCTGSRGFHRRIESKQFELAEHHFIPVWDGMRDRLYVYRKVAA